MDEELARKQRKRGYSDGKVGHSPAQLRGPYMEGYIQGRSGDKELDHSYRIPPDPKDEEIRKLKDECERLKINLDRCFGSSPTAYMELAEQANATEKFLLHLVDVVWSNAMEDGQVPSTDHALKLIEHARSSFTSEEAESHVLPFSVVMFDSDEGWEQYGVYATREEADAVVPKLLAQHHCPVRVADTRRCLRHPKPIMDFKGIEPQ